MIIRPIIDCLLLLISAQYLGHAFAESGHYNFAVTDAAHHWMSQQRIPAQWSLRECGGRSGHDLPSIAENDRREGNCAGDSAVVRTDRRLPCNAAVYDRDAIIELIDWYRCRWEVESITRMVSTFLTDCKE